tara:strand:+ start:844 stop:1047 length:204 start_codon:yes stop_codon:yes gene_type:complete
MKEGVKQLLRDSGIPLQNVADEMGVSLATVSRALDDELIQKVQATAIGLVTDRNISVLKKLEELKSE